MCVCGCVAILSILIMNMKLFSLSLPLLLLLLGLRPSLTELPYQVHFFINIICLFEEKSFYYKSEVKLQNVERMTGLSFVFFIWTSGSCFCLFCYSCLCVQVWAQ